LNPGLRHLAKICLNSLWGKFGQRTKLAYYEFIYDYSQLLAKMNDPKIQTKEWHIINKNCVELKYQEDDNINIEANYISEITAVFTTANARMRLYSLLEWLDPSQICYCDTDSCMFIVDETNPLHKKPDNNSPDKPDNIRFGYGLGEWEDEFKGGWIKELVVGGAKSYSYMTNSGKICIKQKGITLDRANESVVNFDAMKEMVLNHKPIQSKERFTFRWENKEVVTKFIARSIKSTVASKRCFHGYDTVPYGYEV